MTDEQILKLAIEKARKNGLTWKDIFWDAGSMNEFTGFKYTSYNNLVQIYISGKGFTKDKNGKEEFVGGSGWGTSLETIIYNKDFAKAFWGEEQMCTICGSNKIEGGKTYIPGEPDEYWAQCNGCGVEPMDILEFGKPDGTHLPAYLYHLQQMVLYENPLKYLEQFLNEEKTRI